MLLSATMFALTAFLSIIGLRKSYYDRSVHIIFWLSFLIIFVFPNLYLTSISVLSNVSFIDDWLTSSLGQKFNFSKLDTSSLNLVALLFVLFYLLLQFLMKGKLPYSLKTSTMKSQWVYAALVMDVVLFAGFVATNNKPLFVASFETSQSVYAIYCSIFVMTFSGFFIMASNERKYIAAFVFFILPILISFMTSQRPWAIGSLGVALCYFVINTKMSFGRFIFVSIPLMLGVGILLKMVRSLSTGRGIDASSLLLTPDPSFFSLVFIFASPDLFGGMTDGSATKFLFFTGWYPEFLFGELDYATGSANLPGLLAMLQNTWSSGSVHPTIIGWAFVDLAYYAPIIALFMCFAVSMPMALISKVSLKAVPLLIPGISLFVALGVRGTLQQGWARFLVVIFIVFMISCAVNYTYSKMRTVE